MVKQWLVVALGSLLLASCGGGVVRLRTPADGQVFTIQQGGFGQQSMQQLIAATDDDDYTDVSITVRGAEQLPAGVLQCSGGVNIYLQCWIYPPTQGGGMFNQRYTVLVEATRGDFKDVRLVHFQQGTYQQQPTR